MDYATARTRMVDNQLRTSGITDRRILGVMGAVPREKFVPPARAELAYADASHPLGHGRALGAPAALAKLLQLAAINEGDHALDVGAGTGYSTAVLAGLVAEVTGIESEPVLAAEAKANLRALGITNAQVAEGAIEGAISGGGRYDVIVVEGAVDEVSRALLESLADGGRLVAMVANGGPAVATLYVRSGDDVAARHEFNTSLPPLSTAPKPEAFVF